MAVPARIIKMQDTGEEPLGPLAIVDYQGGQVEVSLQVVPDARVGDWVLIHAGFALERLDADQARELWEYLEEAEITGEMPEALKALEDPK
ncbi:MAG: HypC/HybG/HupF family hydrogenase formation chaperone [Candidatus Sumerlaeota bacterium]